MTIEEIAEINPEALVCDGFDEAIIGMAEGINFGPVVAYDKDKMIEILMRDMEVTPDELEDGQTIEDKKFELAYEYFHFNIAGAYMGEYTPVFISKNQF
jgi:hypothetical protein